MVTDEMRASIPPEIAAQLASDAFIDSCMVRWNAHARDMTDAPHHTTSHTDNRDEV